MYWDATVKMENSYGTFNSCTFYSNALKYGGNFPALVVRYSNVSVLSSTFFNHSYSPAIFYMCPTVFLSGNSFYNNSVTFAVKTYYCNEVTIHNCTLRNNTGGVYLSRANFTISNSLFAGNQASAVKVEMSEGTIQNTTIVNNTGVDGGGILAYSCIVEVQSCMVSYNRVSRDGGGILTGFGTMTITNTTFEFNSASGILG
jgi:parallel beta-helix repeat protein